MKYCNTLIAVKDMNKSIDFYNTLFGQDVIVDLGWCKTLTCGLTLQEHFDEIAGFPIDSMRYRSNTMELYFETDDFDAFIELLNKYPNIERLHEAKTYPWLQRGIHIFDPNGHLIEVAESMYSVACKLFVQGKNVEQTATAIMHPVDVVEKWYYDYLKSTSEL
ncbi:MAG: glyoxalase/bleomycin resistance/dioxygenase family protein [Clostridiales bacterium]|nr:glyoxalase/bleomycin resistance/dioxygenase family protein [Clostridiales bacterium]